MGGFATNGVNMLKLKSYMLDGSFTATQFYADIEGHLEDAHVKRAFEELEYFSNSLKTWRLSCRSLSGLTIHQAICRSYL